MVSEDCMAFHRRLTTSTILALALAAGPLDWSHARAAETTPADADDAHPVVSVLDAEARSAIGANLKARRQTVVVTRFSVAPGAAAGRGGLSSQGCPMTPSSATPSTAPAAAAHAVPLDPRILDKLRAQLAKRLALKGTVAAARTAGEAPLNAMVVTGCITRFEAGDAATRMVGFNMGASRLGAHVRVDQKLRNGLKPVAEFDIMVKAASLLPPMSPMGVAMHVATMSRQTLAADATKLGNRTADAIENAFGVGD
jgi:hypothetical protein